MENPFNLRSVANFAKLKLKNGVPETRIPALCKNKFSAIDCSLWHWEQFARKFFDQLKTETRYADTLDETASRFDITDASDADSIIALIRKGANVFVTGKAGTGKTYILKQIVARLNNRGDVAVLAPTGIAAKNADGATIHSFFRMDLGPWVPSNSLPEIAKLTPNVAETLKATSLIIIDEISMVRCDLLDKMSYILKHVKNSSLSFGGTQIVVFGDLYQLIPVTEDEDWDILKTAYPNPYFFSSTEFKKLRVKVVELTKVYRQDDASFKTILNAIRIGHATPSMLCELNTRYSVANKELNPRHGIRLTTHNRKADSFNWAQLNSIPGEMRQYDAEVKGGFLDKSEWPTDFYLKLKVGARVMFLRNDNEGGKYVNGTLGTVLRLQDYSVRVRTDEGAVIDVFNAHWDFYRYTLDKRTNVIYREQYATFYQLPLRLAWCVTIHKSQGLTFEEVVIDASKAFAAGQVYVALSRCKTLEGIHLTDRILPNNVIIDSKVTEFLEEIGIKDKANIVAQQSPEEILEGKILELLQSNKALKANIIAQALKCEKTKINSILYGSLTRKGLVEVENYYWSLKRK